VKLEILKEFRTVNPIKSNCQAYAILKILGDKWERTSSLINIRYHSIKFSGPGDLVLGIYAPLFITIQ
jgi:hypothetical protein